MTMYFQGDACQALGYCSWTPHGDHGHCDFHTVCDALNASNIESSLKEGVCGETNQCHWDAASTACLSGADSVAHDYTDAEKTAFCGAIASNDMSMYFQGDACQALGYCQWTAHGAHGHCDFFTEAGSPVWHLVAAGLLILFVGAFGAYLPMYIRTFSSTAVYIANAFGCGALLAFALIHLLPEAVEHTEEANQLISVGESSMSIAYVLCLVGFIVAAVLETLGFRLSNGRCPTHGAYGNDVESSSVSSEGSCSSSEATEASSFSVNIASKTADVAVMVGLAVHCLFEGLVVGTSGSAMLVWISTLAIVFHKWAAGMALGQAMVNRGHSNRFLIGILTLFVLASPFGVLIGGFVVVSGDSVVGVVNGLCSGLVLHLGVHLIDFTFTKAKSTAKFILGWLTAIIAAGILFGLMMLHMAHEQD
ncbi:MAG: uncharacterized protein KVP18_005062 [Porospora cf. gigantea A]|uniref:uncharacterized protein n=1 Tax=Porospora cf. gigantea A TaxID=2853593 RepID=UPI00355A2A8F|nr:MAG: hypothetical protein KVP18_005062 [Porospora cf. gigantea A]